MKQTVSSISSLSSTYCNIPTIEKKKKTLASNQAKGKKTMFIRITASKKTETVIKIHVAILIFNPRSEGLATV